MLLSVQDYINDASQSTPGGKELTKDYEIFHNVPPYIIQIYTSDKLTKMQIMNQHIFYLYLDRSRRGEKFSFSFLSFISSVGRVRFFSQHLMENVVQKSHEDLLGTNV